MRERDMGARTFFAFDSLSVWIIIARASSGCCFLASRSRRGTRCSTARTMDAETRVYAAQARILQRRHSNRNRREHEPGRIERVLIQRRDPRNN